MKILLQYLLPQRIIAWIAHSSANCRIKFIKNFLIAYFIKRYPVKMAEAIEPDPFKYANYNEFFTRKLKPELRPIASENGQICSPADGQMAELGKIKGNQLLQAKNHYYSVQALLAGSSEEAKIFENGYFATIYLAPIDYHRVHCPLDAKLESMRYIPGTLFSVNTKVVEQIPGLFARNERVAKIFSCKYGKMAVVMVGAMIVGGMDVVWGEKLVAHSPKLRNWDYGANGPEFSKGAELGSFRLGSTVIVLFSDHRDLKLQPELVNQHIKYGQVIGSYYE